MSDLFSRSETEPTTPGPLADRLRPGSLDQVVGQDHLLGDDGPLRRMIAAGKVNSLVFWGQPERGFEREILKATEILAKTAVGATLWSRIWAWVIAAGGPLGA